MKIRIDKTYSELWNLVNDHEDNIVQVTAEMAIKTLKKLQKENERLEESLKTYKEDNDNFESSTHIDDFMYEFNVNDRGEILCLIKVHGIEHTFGITEKDARGFLHIFKMKEMEKKFKS